MKKLLTLALVGAMLSATGITAFAETTNVSYNVDPSYTVSIPAAVTLSDADVTAVITASDVILEDGKQIKVELTSASNTDSGSTFSAKNGDSAVTYTITGDKAIAVGDTVATFTANGSKTLTFSAADKTAATVAGAHTETLTFNIAVEDAAAVSSNPFDAAEGALSIQIAYPGNADVVYDAKFNFTKSGDTYTYVSCGGSFTDGGATLTKSGDNLVLHVIPVTWSSDYNYDITINTVNNTYTVSNASLYGKPITLTNWKYGDTDLAGLLTKV